MFATGFAIFLGLVFIFIKLGRRTMLRMLGHDVWLDIGVTMLTLAIHWGSFSGVMAANGRLNRLHPPPHARGSSRSDGRICLPHGDQHDRIH